MTSTRADTALVPFGPEIWFLEAWVRFMGVPLKTRMTVVRLSPTRAHPPGSGLSGSRPPTARALPPGSLWLHSPIGELASLRPQLDALGEVGHLVAPNALHHLGLARFAEAYPDAITWATKSVEARSGMPVQELLTGPPQRDTTPAAWGPDLELCVLGGNLLFDEALVLHRPSRTLIVTDLVEKIDESCGPSWAVRVATLFGLPRGKPMPAPEHRMFAVDPEPLRRAKQRVLAWDFDRMIIAHGPNVETNAKDELASCFDAAIRAATGRRPLSIRLRKLWIRMIPS